MEKFLNIPVYVLVASGQTDSDGTATDQLLDSTATFVTDGVQPGDLVHQSTDNTYFTVKTVDSQTALTLEPAGGIDTTKDYFIHSGSVTSSQLVSAIDITLVEQRSPSLIWIRYDGPAASDLITITHYAVGLGDESPRDAIQDLVVQANQTHWKQIVTEAGDALAVAGCKVIGIGIS